MATELHRRLRKLPDEGGLKRSKYLFFVLISTALINQPNLSQFPWNLPLPRVLRNVSKLRRRAVRQLCYNPSSAVASLLYKFFLEK
jgi:hypothetical protein